MSKFNKKATEKTTNISGHGAYDMKDKEKLVTMVLTSFFLEGKYYGDNTDSMFTLADKVCTSEPKFVCNLARYARKEMHMRSVSHGLAALVSHNNSSKPFIKEVVADVVERPDDITEILAFYLKNYGKPIPNGLKKALADALGKFDTYAISKYSGGDREVRFKDVLRLTHAKPKTPEQEKLFSDIINDTLPKAERWETELSARGNKKEVWEELIDSGRVGYMAALRNLRNIIKSGASNLDKVLEMIADPEAVKRSKQLPFRYYAAYQEIKQVEGFNDKVFDALEAAISASAANLPHLPGKTVIAIDTSGSMNYPLSRNSKMRCADIARLLGVVTRTMCDEAIVFTFDTELYKYTIRKKSGILESVDSIDVSGGGTDMRLPILAMIEKKIVADRLIYLSDNEVNRGFWTDYSRPVQVYINKYRETINPDLWVHAIDLEGYGTQQFMGKNTNIISGWNESILSFIMTAEEGIINQVKAIEQYA